MNLKSQRTRLAKRFAVLREQEEQAPRGHRKNLATRDRVACQSQLQAISAQIRAAERKTV